jgi:hypothetical protein
MNKKGKAMKRKTYITPAMTVVQTKPVSLICGTNIDATHPTGTQNASSYAASREGGHWDDSDD